LSIAFRHVVAELHVDGAELALELLHRPRADDRRGHGRVADDEGECQVDQADARLVGELSELLDPLELQLVLGQR